MLSAYFVITLACSIILKIKIVAAQIRMLAYLVVLYHCLVSEILEMRSYLASLYRNLVNLKICSTCKF